MVEGAPLLREYTSKGYRGFESHPLRHSPPILRDDAIATQTPPISVLRATKQSHRRGPLRLFRLQIFAHEVDAQLMGQKQWARNRTRLEREG